MKIQSEQFESLSKENKTEEFKRKYNIAKEDTLWYNIINHVIDVIYISNFFILIGYRPTGFIYIYYLLQGGPINEKIGKYVLMYNHGNHDVWMYRKRTGSNRV